MADFDHDTAPYPDEPRYDRDARSASPRHEPRADRDRARSRSRSPNGRPDDRERYVNEDVYEDFYEEVQEYEWIRNGRNWADQPRWTRVRRPPPEEDEEGAQNPGSNLFVTGIHPRLTEDDLTRLFEKYGEVESCSIMVDPHTRESRGFGFVNMITSEQADAAKEGLQGEVIEGRTLSIEKARRNKPRTPTPGKYFGPPKRGFDDRGPPRRGERYDDRRAPGGGNWRRRDDDYYRYDRYDRESYSDRRGYGRDYDRGGDRGGYRGRDYGDRDYRRGSRDDYGYRGGGGGGGGYDRYSRDDRRDDRRGGAPSGTAGDDAGGRAYYDRDANAASYDAPPREPRGGAGGDAYGGRSYEGRGDERYSGR
ncbi:hypothetical protein N7532_006310 [Penicillium argentinense]|uniref:RRM domain-containing protein n=1 Tax=Penicillium argentinense TaxID=1131581 RepID=A0A9W9FFP0_9EURO|nr:uncharacterized protein N7532_006310 [Penicillium argentinense]KAJ5099309.1 hypothetical protein N7532_006310 [Penicillium argentinense]